MINQKTKTLNRIERMVNTDATFFFGYTHEVAGRIYLDYNDEPWNEWQTHTHGSLVFGLCVCVLLCFIYPILGNRYGSGVILLQGTWGGRICTYHHNYIAGYTSPLLFLPRASF